MQDNPITKTPEQDLMEMVLKYRDAITHSEYLPVGEREADRQKLNAIYAGLNTIRQKILDSKCYYELGKLQKELSDKFLAEESTPLQRIYMLSYLVRSLCHPVVFVSTRSTVTTTYHAGDQQQDANASAAVIESAPQQETGKHVSLFRSRNVSAADVQQMQREVRAIFRGCPDIKKLCPQLSLSQAQVLSQLAASGDVKLTVASPQVPRNNLVTSVVLKDTEGTEND